MASCPAPAAASALASRVARLRWLCASPKLPGFRNFNRVEYAAVNVSRLERKFEAGDVVDAESLKAKGIIKKLDTPVKVLAGGEITKPLTIKVDKISAAAVAKIEAAGGKVEQSC